MYFPPITELSMVGVSDVGVPNYERIVLRPTDAVNLAEFGIMVGWRDEGGLVTPFMDQFFWFGDVEVAAPSWIVVYTRAGQTRQSVESGFGKVYWFYWGKSTTLFTARQKVPVLFRFTNILIGSQLGPHEPERKRLT